MDTTVIINPTISVLLPVYNCEKYIFDAVQSILTQTYSHFELLIIDDCSTDNTLQICKSLQDDRIVIIEKEKNSGYTNSLNYGLSIAKGKYIARMDGDDISVPTRFEKQVAFMEANEDVVVCGTTFLIIGTNQVIDVPEFHEIIKIRLLYGNCVAHPTVMLRKSLLIKNSITYNTAVEPAEDYDLWVRLSAIGKLHNLQECLLHYRVHDSQVSSLRNQNQIACAKAARYKLLTLLDDSITSEQQAVYLKAIDSQKKMNFQDFLIFVDLKKNMIIANHEGFFNDGKFRTYWFELEAKFISYYFKSQQHYSIRNFKQYLLVSKNIEKHFKLKELFKFTVKSFINYKVR